MGLRIPATEVKLSRSFLAVPTPTRGPADGAGFSGRFTSCRSNKYAYTRRTRHSGIVTADSVNRQPKIEDVRTYIEEDATVRPAQKGQREGSLESSIASLVPGGRASERPNQLGATTILNDRAANAPLKIAMDLRLHKARQKRIQSQRALDTTTTKSLQTDSEDAFRKALAMDPSDIRGYVSMGTLFQRQNRLVDARKCFEDGCAVSQGNNAYVWTALANLERREGNYAAARNCFDAALVADPGHAAAWHGWGMLERAEGNYTAARDAFIKGIDATKDAPNSYLLDGIANLAGDLDLLDEARQWFRTGTNTVMGANSHALYTSWACLEWRKGDVKVAPYLFQMALRQQPNNRFALLSYAMMEKELGNMDSCRKLLERSIAGNPTDPALYQAYAMVCADDGNIDEARTLYQTSIKANQRHQQSWQAWGILEWQQGNTDAARKLFQKGIWADPKSPNNVYLWQSWAVMEGKLGNAIQARTLFKKGLKLEPANEACWQAWIDMEEELGLYETAGLLRNYRMAAFNRIAVPSNFSTLPTTSRAGNVIKTVQSWTRLFDRSTTVTGDSESAFSSVGVQPPPDVDSESTH